MAKWELFQNKNEGKIIGSFECSSSDLVETFLNMMNFLGMSNPKGIMHSSKKAVSLNRNGNKFTITLHNFYPPIKLSWSGILPFKDIEKLLMEAIQKRKKIAYINSQIVDDTSTFQLAFA